jgi:hypothetical protein
VTPSVNTVADWIESELRLVKSPPSEPVEISYAIEWFHPAHASTPTTVEDHRIWYAEPALWRHNIDRGPSERMAFWDRAFTPDEAWGLAPGGIDIMRPGVGVPPGNDVTHNGGIVLGYLEVFLHGALAISSTAHELDRSSVAVEGGRLWSAVLTAPELRAIRVEGRWDAANNRGFATGSRHIEDPPRNADEILRTIVSEQWEFDAGVSRWIAPTVRDSLGDKTTRLFRLKEIRSTDRAALRKLVVTPSAGTPDAIRGLVAIVQIRDFRPDRRTIETVGPEGSTVAPIPGLPPPQSSSGVLRILGYVTAGVLLAVLVALRLRRAF